MKPPLAILWLLAAVTDPASWEARLEEARRTYAVEEARELVADLSERAPSPEWRLLYIRSQLLVAELLRIEWEKAEGDRSRRRELGREIDERARKGLDELVLVPDSSQKYRLEADLVSTMIRTDFDAKRYRKRMERAAERALELDPESPRAHVSVAKPLIFAGERRGGDPARAIELLTRALELDPDLEQALLLRAEAWERLGEPEKARADRRQALQNNPACRPALDALAEDGHAATLDGRRAPVASRSAPNGSISTSVGR